ncbi:hypothetical protein F2P56_029759 [Juglans regia]|uniref:Reverse transcriptase domain-containing protein n=1 Tax=Juglans regia TaxID=51240 RepID=A0A833UDS0_JUGRE|nr:hypothetical protein F2P56_029759 [Juglans regia]
MSGIGEEVIKHELNVDPKVRPVKQKKKKFSTEKYEAITEEVDRLLAVGFIKESHYPEWQSNVVLVKKSNGKWRMCVEFTDLNKSCLKDSFPLPRIDLIVDATTKHKMLRFMDVYSGYNQIKMKKADQEKTASINDRGLYCYKVIHFGLKNAGATYQRLVNKMFKDQIGRSMEAYVNDLLVKSREFDQHIENLREVFQILRQYQMKLNPTK